MRRITQRSRIGLRRLRRSAAPRHDPSCGSMPFSCARCFNALPVIRSRGPQRSIRRSSSPTNWFQCLAGHSVPGLVQSDLERFQHSEVSMPCRSFSPGTHYSCPRRGQSRSFNALPVIRSRDRASSIALTAHVFFRPLPGMTRRGSWNRYRTGFRRPKTPRNLLIPLLSSGDFTPNCWACDRKSLGNRRLLRFHSPSSADDSLTPGNRRHPPRRPHRITQLCSSTVALTFPMPNDSPRQFAQRRSMRTFPSASPISRCSAPPGLPVRRPGRTRRLTSAAK